MAKQITCEADAFGIGMSELLADIEPKVAENVSAAITKSARKGARLLREDAKDRWKGKTGQEYAAGFASKTTKTGKVSSAEIGNKNMPGLVHLLEKGHETLTSRRAKPVPHVGPVYDVIEPEVIREVSNAVGRALKG